MPISMQTLEEGAGKHCIRKGRAKGLSLNKQFENKETSSFVIGSEVYGREEDKRKIIDMLLTPSGIVSGGTTPVISVIGTPEDCNAKRIIKQVIEKSTGNKCDLMDLDGLHSQMWESLKEKKYLLVLDDVWNEDQGDWDELMPLFQRGLDGCKILVTTRSQKAALVIGNSDTAYHLKGLSNDDCRKIFTKRASFTRTEEEEYPNLHSIGKELMRKCGGVPLAAKILGGLMRFKREEREWLNVQNSNIWIWKDYKKKNLPVQAFVPHLKHCFAF
ncbi:putative disease resistance protein RGA3 [Olea europaea var. sylvestris]|uniref:putative disease resistance protein RGA3 n=1 Tax=Olea europaea var. sylvestris TaxID=158386 RepID=UPI000C1D15D2|nr:putative disease resistance protein RGA3 [Olea europaea var. sylvestris]